MTTERTTNQPVQTLTDDDVVTVRVDRRSFLARVGFGTAAAGALGLALLGGCFGESGSDQCNSNDTDREFATFGGGADCDSD